MAMLCDSHVVSDKESVDLDNLNNNTSGKLPEVNVLNHQHMQHMLGSSAQVLSGMLVRGKD